MHREFGCRLGGRIRELREARGMTQAQLGALVLKSAETISNFERGKTLPSVMTIADIARSLNVELRDLFDFEFRRATPPADDKAAAIIARARLLGDEDLDFFVDFLELLIDRRRSRSETVKAAFEKHL